MELMTLNQASRRLDSQLLDAINGSGLPLRVIELQLLNLLHIVQEHLEKEETAETEAASPETDTPSRKEEPSG